MRPDDPEGQAVFARFLDSPRRVVLEVEPTQRIGYDGGKMGKATADWMAANSGAATGTERGADVVSEHLGLSADEVLTTTRAVRKRLDLSAAGAA